jgi:hypothetical protein
VRAGWWWIAPVLAVGVIFSAVAAATAAVTLNASINGTNLAHATEAAPVPVVPGKPITIALVVHNGTSRPIAVGSVNLEGRVAGLTFFSFDTLVRFAVPPEESKSLAYVLDKQRASSRRHCHYRRLPGN